MDTKAIDALLDQRPELENSRSQLEAMQPGACCIHQSWGFGVIQAFEPESNKLVIDFESKSQHRMDVVFCLKKLEILGENSLLARRHKDPEAFKELLQNSPVELVVEVLQGADKHQVSPKELENALARIVGPEQFKRWWTKTKKLLLKDARIQTPSRRTDPYVLREEPIQLEQEILEDFYVLKHPKKKILLAEKLYQLSDNVKELQEDLPNIFEHLTQAVRASMGLSQAERIHGVWVRNDLARHLHEDPEQIEPTSKSIIAETEDISALASEIPSTYQKRLLDLISRTFPDNWEQVIIEVLRNSSGKMISECIGFLAEHKHEKLIREHLVRWLADQALHGPLLLWMARNRNSRKFQPLMEGLISPRFFSNMLQVIDSEALDITGNRKISLVDWFNEDRELIADMLKDASEEEAHDLAQGLLLNQGFESLLKRTLLARFIREFPSIQTLVDSGVQQRSEELVVSPESFEKHRAEYKDLIEDKIPQNKAAIEVAREHGDLRENSEYKMARQDQEILMARRARLERDLARARQIDFSEAALDSISIGSLVTLRDAKNKREQYAILGAWDSDPSKNILSYQTPLGQALLGKKTGDKVLTDIDNNVVERFVEKLERWVDTGRKL